MDPLHGCDHPELPEAPDVVRMQVLGVLDPPAKIGLARVRREGSLIEIQHLAVGAVSDRVSVQLVAVLDGERGRALDVLDRLQVEAGAVQVLVRLQQPGAVGSQRTVDLPFDRAHGEKIAPESNHLVLGQLHRHLFIGGEANHHVEPDRQPSFGCEPLHEIDGLEGGSGIVEAGDAVRERFPSGEFHGSHRLGHELFLRPKRPGSFDRRIDRLLGRFTERTGRIAVRVVKDLSARGVSGQTSDASQLQRQCIGERRVSAGVGEEHRVQGGDPRQARVDRQSLDGGSRRPVPLLLMPSPTENPLTGLRISSRVRDHGDDLFPVRGPGEIECQHGPSEVGEVTVAFDEPGNRQLALEVDHLGRLAHVLPDLPVASHRDDAIAGHGDRLGFGKRLVHGDDLSVAEHEVCRRGCTGREQADGPHQSKTLQSTSPVHWSRASPTPSPW